MTALAPVTAPKQRPLTPPAPDAPGHGKQAPDTSAPDMPAPDMTTGPAPRLRLLPAPNLELPETPLDAGFEARPTHGRTAGPSSLQQPLPLQFRLPGGLTVVPDVPAHLRGLPDRVAPASGYDGGRGWSYDSDDPDDGPSPTGRAGLPDARTWAARLAQAMVEVTTAGRPVSQLMRWTSGAVYDELRAQYVPRAMREVRRRRVRLPERVHSVRVCEPADGVAEASVVLVGGTRPRAVALRIEGWDGRWVCTACEWL